MKRKFIAYPKIKNVKLFFEKECNKRKNGYDDYDILEEKINGKLVVFLRAIRYYGNKYVDAIVCGYRNTSLIKGRRVEQIPSEEEMKSIESKLKESNIRVLRFF